MSSCNRKIIYKDTLDNLDIEKSIITKYRKNLWSKFIKGIKTFEMIEDGDVIAICISGGKDSLVMAKLFQEYQKHVNKTVKLKFIAMDPGFSKENKELLKNTCLKLKIDIDIFQTNIFDVVDKIAKDYPCYMCARMRRGSLYDYAKKLGCNKLALGHHYNDFIETIMLNVLYGGQYQAMMPKIRSTNYEEITLIRPLVYVREENIIEFNEENKINNMDCGCTVAAKTTSSKRREIKELIENLKKTNPYVEDSIFASSMNVNFDAVLGYKKNGIKKVLFKK